MNPFAVSQNAVVEFEPVSDWDELCKRFNTAIRAMEKDGHWRFERAEHIKESATIAIVFTPT